MRIATVLLLALALGACGERGAPGGQHTIDLPGQWVVINYWARWCKPCIEEIPELNELDRAHDNVTVLGVNYDGLTGDALAAEGADLGVSFGLLQADPAAEIGQPRPVVLPTTVILAPQGAHHATLAGPQTVDSLLAAMGLAGTARE